MRVLVAGSRSWTDAGMVYTTLDNLYSIFNGLNDEPFTIISGVEENPPEWKKSPAADIFAARWAKDRGVRYLGFPADWKRHHKSAGPRRNVRMLVEGEPELVVAFSDDLDNSRGTKHMVTIAQRGGVPVRVIRHLKEEAA